MGRVLSFFSRKSDSLPGFISRKNQDCLPLAQGSKHKFQIRALLSHCLYRRVVLWSFVVIALLSFAFLNPRITQNPRNVLDLINLGQSQREETEVVGFEDVQPLELPPLLEYPEPFDKNGFTNVEPSEEESIDEVEVEVEEEDDSGYDDGIILNGPHWLRYRHMDGYYNGLRSLVPFSRYKPEYPSTGRRKPKISVPSEHRLLLPRPTPYIPHPKYDSAEYLNEYDPVHTCYIDPAKKFPAPNLYAYNGIPQGQAKPAIGSYSLLGLREDVCFDRYGRYGPYGLGYSVEEGGTGEAIELEDEGSGVIWEHTGKIDYSDADWGSAQQRCFMANAARFLAVNRSIYDDNTWLQPRKLYRQAVVVRTYVGFKWTAHSLLNFRAMITELNLRSGSEYDVHFLLHVRDNNAPIWADGAVAQAVLDANVPPEFHSICTLWSEAQMKLYYPGDFGETFENPSNGDIHGVYRSAHMPLQHFANMHPEYEHFWNWEMDMRWTGSYYELFDRLGKWGQQQSRQGMWERSSKYYIPDLHGDWDQFTKLVENETEEAGQRPVMGPIIFAGKTALQEGEEEFLPASCTAGSDMSLCGVGEDADLITLNPLFDADESGWVFASDVTGYDQQYPQPPRRCAIVTASRLSRRLLSVMHEETWRLHHSMFTEMFPPSMAFHHGLKAVYAPHPVYLDRAWPLEEIEKAFNGGRDHTSGGHGSPFDLQNEHNHKGTSWYYNSEFAGLLWRRWLGYAQMDGRGNNGGQAGEGILRGGREEEMNQSSSGRLCLRSMLIHPIKWENPNERDS